MRIVYGFVAVLVLGVAGCNGCHEEPTIVIRFEPSDADVRPAPKPTPTPTPVPEHVEKKHARECKAAADCVIVPEDCCDCANGGKQQAIPKAKVAAAKAERAKHCKKVMCTMMFSTDPSCGKRPDCVDGSCVMVEKKK